MLPRDSCEEPEQRLAAQRQRAAKLSGRDVYIATGVLCVSSYRSALGLYLNDAVKTKTAVLAPFIFSNESHPGASRLN